MTNNAKQAILKAIEEACRINLSVDAKNLSEAYQMLVQAECQARMTDWQTAPCECDGCNKDKFPEDGILGYND